MGKSPTWESRRSSQSDCQGKVQQVQLHSPGREKSRRKSERNGEDDDPSDFVRLHPDHHRNRGNHRRPLLWKVQPFSSVCTVSPKQSRPNGQAYCRPRTKHCGANEDYEQTAHLHVTSSWSQTHPLSAAGDPPPRGSGADNVDRAARFSTGSCSHCGRDACPPQLNEPGGRKRKASYQQRVKV